MQTELMLNFGGLPPLSARGCIQDLRPVASGTFRRTVNGALVFIGVGARHKYRSTIRCQDQAPLAIMPVGAEVQVSCIQQLCQKIAAHEKQVTQTLERPAREGSIRMVDAHREVFTDFILANDDRSPLLQIAPWPRDLFVFYHPVLNMRVVSFTLSTDEWANKSGWTLELEEV